MSLTKSFVMLAIFWGILAAFQYWRNPDDIAIAVVWAAGVPIFLSLAILGEILRRKQIRETGNEPGKLTTSPKVTYLVLSIIGAIFMALIVISLNSAGGLIAAAPIIFFSIVVAALVLAKKKKI